jgi:IS1 family transposase
LVAPRTTLRENIVSKLSMEQRVRVAAALADGMSMHGVERLTGVTRQTVGAFLLALGDGCALVHASHMHDLMSDVIECDEVWAFVGTKESRRDEFDPAEFGDAYTFVALDATSRAIVSHLTDKRTAEATRVFIADLMRRVPGKPQITTDGWVSYVDAIERAFGTRVHYAKNLKTYAADEANGASRDDVRYSRGRCIASQKIPVFGAPDESKITTAHVERSNLTTRMWCRRLTRLTTGFSRRLVFLRAAMALHFAAYNFVRVHAALRVTPAMQLGVTDHIWSMEELVEAALYANSSAPPAVPPPVPPTPAEDAGARVRAARRRATRPMTPTRTIAPSATVALRRAEAPHAAAILAPAPSGSSEPDGTTIMNQSANDDQIVPRALLFPSDAATDFRWMW